MQRIAPPTKPTVLLVDDDAAFRSILAEVLEETGCRIIQADNGVGALDMLKNLTPDLVLIDLVMPVMNGWQLVTAMNRDPRLASIPVAVLSAWDPGGGIEHARVLHKPLNLPNIVGLLDAVEAASVRP
jgi:CheY-like chemotaxis protein